MDDEVDLWIAVIQQAIKDALYNGENHGRNGNPTHREVAQAKLFLRNEDGAFGDICKALGVDLSEARERICVFSERCMAENPHNSL